jgi:hypothetical protein
VASAQGRPVPVDAAIHHREDPGVARTLGSTFIDNAILEPQRGELQPDALVDNRRDMLWPTKYVYDVHLFAGSQHVRQMCKIRDSRLAEDGFRSGGNGDDAITKAL